MTFASIVATIVLIQLLNVSWAVLMDKKHPNIHGLWMCKQVGLVYLLVTIGVFFGTYASVVISFGLSTLIVTQCVLWVLYNENKVKEAENKVLGEIQLQ